MSRPRHQRGWTQFLFLIKARARHAGSFRRSVTPRQHRFLAGPESLEPRTLLSVSSFAASDAAALSPPAPVAKDDYYWTPADTPLHVSAPGVLANDYDPEGQRLEAVNLMGSLSLAHGTLYMGEWRNDGSFDYHPYPGHNGRDTFSYYCVDPDGWMIETLVTVDVGNFNRAPTVVDPIEDVTVDQGAADSVIDLEPVFDDLDLPRGDELTYSVTISPPILPIVDGVTKAGYKDIHQNMLYTHLGDNRGYDTEQHDFARDNIGGHFESLGLTANFDTMHEVTDIFNNSRTFDPPLVNVVGVKPGLTYPEKVYLVGAHYDSVHNPGADDNASGVAAIMEAARVLSQHSFESTLVFVAFDGEEDGLFGSMHYAEHHYSDHNMPDFSSELVSMVNLDMVAYNPPGANHDVVSIFDVDDKGNVKSGLVSAFEDYAREVVGRDDGLMGMSDHEYFDIYGFDAAMVIETEVHSNPHYHRQTDAVETPNYLDYDYASDITRAVTGYLAQNAKPVGTVDALAGKVQDDQLIIDYDPSKAAGAVITVRATDTGGLFAEDSFSVIVNPKLNEFAHISGETRIDVDGDGVAHGDEPGQSGVTVYLDLNNNGQRDWTDSNGNGQWDKGEGERWTLTAGDDPATGDVDESGRYSFAGLQPGTYVVRQMVPDGWRAVPPVPYQTDESLVTHFRFNGDAIDAVSGTEAGNTGAVFGDGRFNVTGPRSYFFDGSSWMSADLDALPLGDAPRTVSVWVKSADGLLDGESEHIVSWGTPETGNAFGVMLSSGGRWYGYSGESLVDSGAMADTEWHQLTLAYDGTDARFFVDGQFVGSEQWSLSTESGPLLIGTSPHADKENHAFDGMIDEVRVYERALSDAEVADLFGWSRNREVVSDAYTVRVREGDSLAALDFTVQDITPPAVTGVYVSGASSWSAEFKSWLQSHGMADADGFYKIPTGAEQLDTLPWSNLSQVRLTFSEDVDVDMDDLMLVGTSSQEVAASDFAYDANTFGATWSFPVLDTDKYVLALSDEVRGRVSGLQLDGEYTDGAGQAESGDGVAGGDFQFRFRVLPGDVSNSGNVVAGDVSVLASAFGSFAGGSGDRYEAFVDLDGSGNIVAGDVSILASHFGQFLPSAEPSLPVNETVVLAVSSSGSVVAAEDAGDAELVSTSLPVEDAGVDDPVAPENRLATSVVEPLAEDVAERDIEAASAEPVPGIVAAAESAAPQPLRPPVLVGSRAATSDLPDGSDLPPVPGLVDGATAVPVATRRAPRSAPRRLLARAEPTVFGPADVPEHAAALDAVSRELIRPIQSPEPLASELEGNAGGAAADRDPRLDDWTVAVDAVLELDELF